MIDLLELAVVFSATSVVLVICEWSYVVLMFRKYKKQFARFMPEENKENKHDEDLKRIYK
jgi:hypothetical protein